MFDTLNETLVSVVSAHGRKKSIHLGDHWDRGVPIEVIPMAYKPIMNTLTTLMGGEAVLRMAKSKAVSLDHPVTPTQPTRFEGLHSGHTEKEAGGDAMSVDSFGRECGSEPQNRQYLLCLLPEYHSCLLTMS